METIKEKSKRIICNLLVLLIRFAGIILLIITPILLIYSTFVNTKPYLFIFASLLEIYAVLIIFLAEVFSSSFKERWRNPELSNISGTITWNKKYVIINDKKHLHYIGVGIILKWILDQTERILWIPTDIKRAWYWLRHSPTPENCKITWDADVTEVGTINHLQKQINELKEYSSLKILGYLLLFIAFILQLIYGLSRL